MTGSRHDLHSVLDLLRRESALLEVDRPVDRGWEISAVLDRLGRGGWVGPALFTAVQGQPGWSVLGNLFADRRTIGLILGIDPAELSREFRRRMERPLPPVL